MPRGFCVHNLGCKVNRVEADTLAATLIASGASPVETSDAAVIIVNTCTVTAEAGAKARKAVRQALKAPQSPWVIVTGCAAVAEPASYERLGNKAIVLPDKNEATAQALEILETKGTSLCPSRTGPAFNTRVGIKVQDGCDNRCAFCIVSTVRGPARSVPLAQVLREASSIEEQGARELVVTGINLGRYHSSGANLAALLEALLAATQDVRYRLSSIEPPDLTDELLGLMARAEGRVCAHLHVPLQSGADEVLRGMGRHYRTAFYRDRISSARNMLNHIAITTDLITGFPGELEAHHAATLQLCEELQFSRLHVFRYSRRPGTPAATMPNQVASNTAAARAKELRGLSQQLAAADARRRVGTCERVLVEREGTGTSESYHPVTVPKQAQRGSLLSMRFTGSRDNLLTGTIIQ